MSTPTITKPAANNNTTPDTVTKPQFIDLDAPATEEARSNTHRLFTIVAIFAMVVGAGSFLGGLTGAAYTWNQASIQSVVTPDDASFPGTAVRGPLTMWAQSDIINAHQLEGTDGLYFAEMDRQVAQLDEAGQPVLDEAGEAVMVPNAARAGWITATTLTTALGLGLIAYALSAFAMIMGLVMLALGFVVLKMRTPQVA